MTRTSAKSALIDSEPDVFLSSAFRNFMDVRDEIRELAKERIWAVETERKDLDTRRGVSPFVIVDTLVEQIRKSKVFICVLRDWYGSSVFGKAESVSILETEIYEAALYHNNAYFLLMDPFNTDPRLSGLLNVIGAIRPGIISVKALSKEEVLDRIKRILADTRQTRQQKWSISLRKLVTRLAGDRGYPKPDVEFFDKVFQPVSTRPDKDHVQILLKEIGREPSIEKRLTGMWIALRELSAAPYDNPDYSEYLPLWDQALGEWASAAAWYGLHGHLYAGRLAAVNSMLHIRKRMDWSASALGPQHHIHSTLAGRASEYYSIAKLMQTPVAKNRYLCLALDDLNRALKAISGDPSGYIAIRGHLYADLGRLQDALSDFQEMRRLREMRGDSAGIGEALADLGLINFRLRNLREARRLLTQGVMRLHEAGAFTFAIRARKRLALSHLATGHPVQALRELCSAYDSVEEHQVYDQTTPLMETIHELACRLGVWKRKVS